ncbi:THUMP-like domain-containing protein [Micropruina sp.]|uniref:THUMP-like domain-containing protein n=1 Tax=Micropruina sp. TaxID=2737536 RepID=UPI0039E43BF6
MDAEQAAWLVSPAAQEWLARAAAETDPGSLAAAERLRRGLSPQHAALVLGQEALRRRAVGKFGPRAAALFFTADGLEQATRRDVAQWRAQRFRAAGVRTVIDLGCGLGADALALLDAGLEVIAVEADPATAVLARANLGVEVVAGDAVALLDELDDGAAAVFCDPARRTSEGRSWRVQDLSPPWSFVEHLLATRTCCVKLGPGLPLNRVPGNAAATWVSESGDLVELSLWRGAWSQGREAVLLPSGEVLAEGEVSVGTVPPAQDVPADQTSGAPHPAVPVKPGEVLYEPDPAVIRAGLVDRLAVGIAARRVSPGIAYLAGAEHRPTPFATAFEVVRVLDAGERALRAWVRAERIGTLEIKKRGLEVDPAVLRRRLKPSGPNAATIVLTPTPDGARALVVRRL